MGNAHLCFHSCFHSENWFWFATLSGLRQPRWGSPASKLEDRLVLPTLMCHPLQPIIRGARMPARPEHNSWFRALRPLDRGPATPAYPLMSPPVRFTVTRGMTNAPFWQSGKSLPIIPSQAARCGLLVAPPMDGNAADNRVCRLVFFCLCKWGKLCARVFARARSWNSSEWAT